MDDLRPGVDEDRPEDFDGFEAEFVGAAST